MSSTKVELHNGRIGRIKDLADLAEMLFPGNRNQQHAFLVIWTAIKWSPDGLVPDLGEIARRQDVSRRTCERVRAKMRRLGLIDHVSRFGARHGYREGWILSSRCERGLTMFAQQLAAMRDADTGDRDKELLLINFLAARCAAGKRTMTVPARSRFPENTHEVMTHVQHTPDTEGLSARRTAHAARRRASGRCLAASDTDIPAATPVEISSHHP